MATLAADFGVPATMRLTDRAEEVLRRGKARGPEALAETLRDEDLPALLVSVR